MDSSHKSKNEPLATPEDYLWDRTGEPDPDVQKLEAMLGQFRHDLPAPVLPQIEREGRWFFGPRTRWFPALAAAAAAVVLVGGITFAIYGRQRRPLAGEGWEVSNVAGTPRLGRRAVRADQTPSHLSVGQTLETDDHSKASLEATDVGMIEIDQNTRLRLLAMGKERKQIALDRGTIHAHIWAPPGEFVVDTPSAVTVDLGCAYTLHVDDSGAGLVRTSLGWVGFKLNGHESFIPSGAACATRPILGPGTPYFEDASAEFRAALTRFDFADTTPQLRAQDLSTVLSLSRKRDALSLWHLLSRVDEDQRVRVYTRLQELAPAPAGVTREGILRLDQPMLDQWWNALGYDDISIWRRWEHSWSEPASATSEKTATTAPAKQ
jgi:FecR protein